MDLWSGCGAWALGSYEAAFRENEMDQTVLPSLTHETLKELGVTAVGHRLKLLMLLPRCVARASRPPLTQRPRRVPQARIPKTPPNAVRSP